MAGEVIHLLDRKDLFGARPTKPKKPRGPRGHYWRSLETFPQRERVVIGGMEYGCIGMKIGEKFIDLDGEELTEVCAWKPLDERDRRLVKEW